MDMTREKELELEVTKLKREKLEIELELCKTQLIALKQTVMQAMETGPRLERRIKEIEQELTPSTPKDMLE